MMTTITRIPYKSLRRNEQHSFNCRVLDIVEQSMGGDSAAYISYKKYADELAVFLAKKAVTESLSLSELDALADSAWISLNYQIQSSMRHLNDDVRRAAEAVNDVFSKTPNPTELPYDEEYAAMRALILQMDMLDPAMIAQAKAQDCYENLRTSVQNFIDARKRVTDTKALKVIGEYREIINGCCKGWLGLAKWIEVMAEFGDEGAQKAAASINVITRGVKAGIERRKKADAASTNIVEELEA